MTLREWRFKNHKTLAQLASEVGADNGNLSRIERGQPAKLPLARELERVTGIPAAAFVMGEAA